MLWVGVLQLVALLAAFLVLLVLVSLRPTPNVSISSTISIKKSLRKTVSDGALLTRRQRASILSLRLVRRALHILPVL